MTANKADTGKPRLDLIEPCFLVGLGKALAYGAAKYAPYNYRKGLAFSRCYAAALRHLTAFWDGEECDPESGLHHLEHAAASLMMLRATLEHRPALDDRPSTLERNHPAEGQQK